MVWSVWDMAEDWPARLNWTPESLAEVLGNRTLRFRTGPRYPTSEDIQWETDCEYIDASLQQFCQWLAPERWLALASSRAPREESETDNNTDSNPLLAYHPADNWVYLDYKYMAELFSDQPDILEAVRWDDFGFPGRTGVESTIWVGSAGAHTPCHYDSYGCNLVLQVYGRKKWVLFPPEDSPSLYPTRLPYEESSVFSQVNVAYPNVQQFPKVVGSHPHVVVLEPGDVLFVPKHWWHYVESLTTSISVNSWIEMASDGEDRLQEAMVRLVLLSIKSDSPCSDQSHWLNPTENVTSRRSNLGYVQAALEEVRAKNDPGCSRDSKCAFAGGCPFPQEGTKTTPPPSKRSKLEDSDTKAEESDSNICFSTPSTWFGPNLVPVLPCTDYFADELCSMQTDAGGSQERTSVDLSAAAKPTAEERTAEETAAVKMATERTAVEETAEEQTSAKQVSAKQTASQRPTAEHLLVKPTLVEETPEEHISSESTDMFRNRVLDLSFEELENTIVNCLVQPHIVQEVAKLLKERLRLS
ncbi:HSPB1-associated protein 1-like isoform X2 [Branchiostoma lanceolatum]|uniref:HSPB1-associated protein 1-like isoform X2 n=1 Tax=Branchiostoma lanceolatum TaxID=7740 RepID=UPI003453C616